MNEDPFKFAISLTILNHLGRQLYRSFSTILGEAISNSWDANAENVRIYIDRKNNSFFIKDDGDGMSTSDFQNKFLKIGYSKRKGGNTSPGKNRPYIGRKGIGKLALLSCSEKITVISKVRGGKYIGGSIDNSDLDKAIQNDVDSDKYELGPFHLKDFGKYTKGHKNGTIIYFENMKEEIKNSLDFLRKILALDFRFSLYDKFNIFLDDKKISVEDLKDLISKTDFVWTINRFSGDPFLKEVKAKSKRRKNVRIDANITGFIVSVEKTKDLNIMSTNEKVGVDIFVNGRLRERGIMRHIPTTRVPEEYIYGQIHFDSLDKGNDDPFTSSREAIIDDEKYKTVLEKIRGLLTKTIFPDWDKWRLETRQEGDAENTKNLSPKERKSTDLFNLISKDYTLPKKSKYKKKIDSWEVGMLHDAAFNFTSYAECFVSENLVRKFIQDKKRSLKSVKTEIKKWRDTESKQKAAANLNIKIRKTNHDVFYLDMEKLVRVAEKSNSTGTPNTLSTDEKQFTPIRNAVMHTSRLTDEAKRKLTTIYDNIKARIKNLLK